VGNTKSVTIGASFRPGAATALTAQASCGPLAPSVVPDWPNDEYDRIYVFQIKDVGGRKDLTFSVEQQGLTDSQSDKCPAQ
jgi:hypothetical protein